MMSQCGKNNFDLIDPLEWSQDSRESRLYFENWCFRTKISRWFLPLVLGLLPRILSAFKGAAPGRLSYRIQASSPSTVGIPNVSAVKNLLAIQETQEMWFSPWVGKIPWRRKWQSTPVFLPGESHGMRNLVGYSPQGHKESDRTEQSTHSNCFRLKIS